MSTAIHQIPSNHTISLPPELVRLIAEHVVADNDTKTLNSCSLAFSHLKTFFQRAIRAQKPFTIMCLPFWYDSKFWTKITTLLELLDANPSFGRDCIREINLVATCSFSLEDPALRLDFILSCCTKLQSFTFDMSANRRDDVRDWTAIYRPIRVAMEGVLRLPSLRHATFLSVNLPWTTLFRSKKSLASLTARSVGYVSAVNHPDIASVQMAEPTTVSRLYVCPSSATALASPPVLAANSIARGEANAEGFAFDFTNLETIDLTSGHIFVGMGTSWPTGFQDLLRRAPNLKKLVFREIKLEHMTGLFDCKPVVDCLATLEHIVWASPPFWLPEAYVGPHPFLPVVSLLSNFPFENSLKSLELTLRFEDLPTDTSQTLADFRVLTDVLARRPFLQFERVQICAQVEVGAATSAQVERMFTDLRYVARELQGMKYLFMLEVKVEEWDSSLQDADL